MMGADNFNYESVEDVFKEMISLLAPEFKGTFKGLILPGPKNDHTISDPGGARRRTPEYNPGDYRIDGAHFRSAGSAVDAAAIGVRSVPKAPVGQFLLTWGEHAQGDDYHLNRASIAGILQVGAYAEINPADAERIEAESEDRAVLQIGGASYEVELKVKAGPAPGVIYLPSGLGGIKLSAHAEAVAVSLQLVHAEEPAGV
jgi:hypothetical protein